MSDIIEDYCIGFLILAFGILIVMGLGVLSYISVPLSAGIGITLIILLFAWAIIPNKIRKRKELIDEARELREREGIKNHD